MKAGSETKRKRGICLAGVVSAVLAGSVLLFPSAAGAETVFGGYSVPSQMEAITRKAGDAAGSPGTMSEVTASTAAPVASSTSLPGIVYDADGRVLGYSSGQGTSRSSSSPGSGSSGTTPGNTSGYANPVSSGQAASSSSGYILYGSSTSRSSGLNPSDIIVNPSDRVTGPGAKVADDASAGNRRGVPL